MLKAKDIMTRDVITVSPDMEIVHATEILLNNQINGVLVLDNNDVLIGIICQSDLISQQKNMPIPSLFTLLDGFIQLTSTKKLKKSIQKRLFRHSSGSTLYVVVSARLDYESCTFPLKYNSMAKACIKAEPFG